MNQRPLVTVEWLASQLADDDVNIVDGSWHMPAENRDAQAEFLEGHIPGSVFFDIDQICAPGDLPHMMPTAADFATSAAKLGLDASKTTIVYDTKGLFSAARVWWMLRTFGFKDVRILDGGMPAWAKADLPLEPGAAAVVEANSSNAASSCNVASIKLNTEAVVDSAQVLTASTHTSAQIIDARSKGRFDGTDPEPRAGLRGGHIPNSLCLPFTELLYTDGRLKSNGELLAVFEAHGVAIEKPVITSCGSGVTAAILSLGLYCVGHDTSSLYDGSWTEWGGRNDLPVVTKDL